jgi:hypothetical protein
MSKHGRGYENANCRLKCEEMKRLNVWGKIAGVAM